MPCWPCVMQLQRSFTWQGPSAPAGGERLQAALTMSWCAQAIIPDIQDCLQGSAAQRCHVLSTFAEIMAQLTKLT